MKTKWGGRSQEDQILHPNIWIIKNKNKKAIFFVLFNFEIKTGAKVIFLHI